MSSILDALKKSERQRSLGRELIFRHASPDAGPRLTGFAFAVLATLLLLVVAIGALLFSLREPEAPVTTPPVVTLTPAEDNKAGTVQGSSDTTAASLPAAPADAARTVENTTLTGPQDAAVGPKPVSPKSTKSAVASHNPVQAQPVPGSGVVPWLSSLPQAFRSSLPPLTVNIHVYSPDQTRRILYINNRPVQQGEQVEGGAVVEEIVEDGVVLQYHGQRFKLPRPS
jgi:general secretion pathway protein B